MIGSLPRRAAVAAVGYIFAVAMLGTTLPTPLYPLYGEELHFSDLMVTIIFATYAVAVMASLVAAGRISDQIGRRPALLAGLLLSALSAIVFERAGLVPLLFAGRFLSGLSAGIFTGTATATLSDLAAPESGGRATLVATVSNLAGLGSGPLVAGLLARFTAAPLQTPFWVDLLLLAPAFILVLAVPETVHVQRNIVLLPRLPRVPRQVWPAFIPASLSVFAGFAVLGLFSSLVPAFMAQVLGMSSPALTGLVAAAVFAASLAGSAVLAPILGSRGLIVGSAGLVLGMVLLGFALAQPSLVLLIGAAGVAGIGQGISFRQGLAALNSSASPARRAELASAYFLVAYLALSLPVVGVGFLTQLAGLRMAGIAFAALVGVIGAGVVFLTWRLAHRRHPSAQSSPASQHRGAA